MRKLIIPAILLSAVAVSAPAAAQYRGGYGYQGGYGHQGGGANIQQQLNQIEQRIDRARDRRLISNNEARRLFRQADQIDHLYDRYRRNGLSNGERRDLQNRIQHLRQRVQFERREGRDDRRDRW